MQNTDLFMTSREPYKTKTFNLSGLKGISDKTLEMHFKLYDGYVKQTNVLNEKIAAILKDGKIDQEETPAYSELTRRMQRIINAFARDAETASTRFPVPITVAGPLAAISSNTASAIFTSCC